MCHRTPEDMMEEATALATQLVGMPIDQLHAELDKLDAKNRVLAVMVKYKLKELAGEAFND